MNNNVHIDISAEGAAACREFAGAMKFAVGNINEASKNLILVFSSAYDDLGPHKDSFNELVMSLERLEKKTTEAIAQLVPGLNETAARIEHHISNTYL